MSQIFFGIFLAAISCIILSCIPGSKIYEYDKAISKCEKSLPRDQTCVITAIPKTMGDQNVR